MMDKYMCVHCMRERGNGCRCVSPFADNAVLADMRDDEARENTQASIIAMMHRMTDNMFLFGDSLRDDNQIVPGITDWLPGKRSLHPDTMIVNPRHRNELSGYDLPDIVEAHWVPDGMVYLVERPAPFRKSVLFNLRVDVDESEE